MDHEEIAEKIRYIVEQIAESQPNFYPSKGRFGNENVELLLQLEAKINDGTSKEFFWQLIGHGFLSPIPKFHEITLKKRSIVSTWWLMQAHCDCGFMVYMKADKTDDALGGFFERIKDYSSVGQGNNKIVSCILQVLVNEPYLFLDDQLKRIELIVNKYQNCINEASNWERKREGASQGISVLGQPATLSDLFRLSVQSSKGDIPLILPAPDSIVKANDLVSNLKNALKNVRYERVKQELKGVSSHINQDKKQLILKYVDLSFSTLLIEALERIDIEIEKPGSKFSYSGSITFVRNIYEQSLREIALTISHRTGKPIPQGTGKIKMGQAISYFRSIDFISPEEEKMLTGFSGLISDTGPHSLTSERYEVRIAKNILVEILCYLTDKTDSYMNKFAKTS